MLDAVKYGAASLVFAGATYLGAYILTPNYAYAEETKSDVVDMNTDVQGKRCRDVKVCDENGQPKKEQPKAEPKKQPKKEPKKAPKKAPKKTPVEGGKCEYNTVLKTVGAKSEAVALYNNYGPDAACSYRAADINAEQEYILSAGDKYFIAMPAAEPEGNIDAKKTFYDASGRIKSIVFTAKGKLTIESKISENDIEDLELKVKKAEAKKEEPKKEDFVPVPAPKQEPKEPFKQAQEEPETELSEIMDFNAAATAGFRQSILDASGSQSVYTGFETGIIVVPSFKLGDGWKLSPFGKYIHTNFPSLMVNGVSSGDSNALEHEFGGGMLLSYKADTDINSHLGDLSFVFGGNYLQKLQEVDYLGYTFEQNQQGGELMLAVDAPGLFYPSDEVSVGMEGSVNGQILRASLKYPGGNDDRGTRADVKGYGALNLTHNNWLRFKAGLGGSSIESMLPDAGRLNGSHLVLGVEAVNDGELGWGFESSVPYGPQHDEYGGEAYVRLNGFKVSAEGKLYAKPTSTGNGDSTNDQNIYGGLKAGYSTDFDMMFVKGLDKVLKLFRSK